MPFDLFFLQLLRHVIKVSHLPLDEIHFRDEDHYIPRYSTARTRAHDGLEGKGAARRIGNGGRLSRCTRGGPK